MEFRTRRERRRDGRRRVVCASIVTVVNSGRRSVDCIGLLLRLLIGGSVCVIDCVGVGEDGANASNDIDNVGPLGCCVPFQSLSIVPILLRILFLKFPFPYELWIVLVSNSTIRRGLGVYDGRSFSCIIGGVGTSEA